MKKILSLILVTLLIFTIIPMGAITASAETEYTSGNYTYTVSNGEATITDFYTSINGDVTLPSTLGGYLVTSIGDHAFYWCSSLTSITIPYSVTSIGNFAFSHCDSLTSITIPDSVTSIGEYAFYNCGSLTSVTIPDSVRNMGYNAFYNTAFYKDINNWENDVLYIGNHLIEAKTSIKGSYQVKSGTITITDYAFSGCQNLTYITIPNSVISIGMGVFIECKNLMSITVDVSNTHYSSSDGVLFNDDKTKIICCPAETYATYCIPNGVISIEDYAFYGCEISYVIIPESVISIGEHAFYGCENLIGVTVPDSVVSIGDSAFWNCYNLRDIILSNSISGIGNWVFAYCTELASIRIPYSVTSIGNAAFYSCYNLKDITFGNDVTSIGDSAFFGCESLDNIYYCGNDAEWDSISIGSDNFYLTNSTRYQHNYKNAFCICGVVDESWFDYTVNDGEVTITGLEGDFFGDVTFPSTLGGYPVTSIGVDDAASFFIFEATTVTINKSIKNIGEEVFLYCDGLTNIIVDTDNPYFSSLDGVLFNKGKTEIICYPQGKTATSYSILNGVRNIGDYAFKDCTSLTSIIIPDSVTSIGDDAFSCCESLTSITIPDSVTSIGDDAFNWCSNLTSIIIPDSVTSIGDSAFMDCTSLTSITIPDSVTSIGNYAFAWCSSLTSITIPDSVTKIENYTFRRCDNLKNIYFCGTEKEWNNISIGYDNDALINAKCYYKIDTDNIKADDFVLLKKALLYLDMPKAIVDVNSDGEINVLDYIALQKMMVK